MNAKEKIRQFVIMARHPGLSYEEALSGEIRYRYCQYTLFDFDDIHIIEKDNQDLDVNDKNINILGRSITAIDVCWALNKKRTQLYITENIYIYCSPSGLWQMLTFDINFETIKTDGTHTTLDDWSEKTCEKIAELIN